jgi:NAD(P)-dependent dehydrogenase (short-subunit alcohol dehydrogenase family)
MAMTILVTGASKGIGRTTAKLFQERGWNVVASMRRPDQETELKQLDNVLVIRLDVTDITSIKQAVAAGIERFGGIDVLLNNAGFAVYGPLEATPTASIREQFDINVFGVLETTKAVLPHMRGRGDGMIINVSSIGGAITYPLGTLYHGSKWAIEGMSEALSFELREAGIAVKIVQPGDVLTDIRIDLNLDDSQTQYNHLTSTFMDSYAPVKAKGSDPTVIAEVIYTAATDGEDRLRYPAGQDCIDKIAMRRAIGEEAFLDDMRSQFQVSRNLNAAGSRR